jgi:hypothetical protein
MKVLRWGQTGFTPQSGTLGFESLLEFLGCLNRDELHGSSISDFS